MNLTKTPESTNLDAIFAQKDAKSAESGHFRVLRRWDEWLRVYMPWLVPADHKVMTYSDDMDEATEGGLMESVDKLREWFRRYDNNWIDPKTGETTAIYATNGECRPSGAYERFSVNEGERLRELLDEIEREHKKAIEEVSEGYVELPMDADGEAIHVGDTLTDGEYTFRVCELVQFADGSWSIRNECGNAWAACDVTHHHEPTVEDVLFEFAQFWSDEELTDIEHLQPDAAQTIADFAAKLRLREDA